MVCGSHWHAEQGNDMVQTADRPAAGKPSPLPERNLGHRSDNFYRHDLDGLRGLAIALVAVFHVWFGRVSGGVDVFLTLSGFFFGGSLLRSAFDTAAVLSPRHEVLRLVRRLVPALVVVLTATAVLTVAIQPPTRWGAFAEQSLASLGYVQNWHLARSAADYLQAGQAVSPLQHLWSMSVQGQFYLTFVVFVSITAVVARRLPRIHVRALVVLCLAALTVASFVFAVYAQRTDPSVAYYNSFARAWELLLGVLAGAVVRRIRWRPWLRTVAAAVALTVILVCGALIDGSREFPGPWTLVPVGATVVLILAAANRQESLLAERWLPAPQRLLATRPLVALGAMAYSLYLWHWPLLIMWLSYSDKPRAGIADGAAVLLVSAVLAQLTMRMVERPLRYRSGPRNAVTALRRPTMRPPTIVLGTAIALLAATLAATSLTWQRYLDTRPTARAEPANGSSVSLHPGARALIDAAPVPAAPMRPSLLDARRDLPVTTDSGCISGFTDPTVRRCVFGDPAATRTIALAGGSHAEHWITALAELGRRHNFKVTTYLKMGCPLSTEAVPRIVGSNAAYPQCAQWVADALNDIVADRPDYVFTTTTRPRDGAGGDITPSSYLGVWQRLSDNRIGILGIRDTPWLVRDGQPFAAADCLADGGDPVRCGMPRSQVLDTTNPTLAFAAQYPLLRPLDMSNAVCRRDVCRAVEGNVLIYHDSHHLSATYVATMTDEPGPPDRRRYRVVVKQ